MMWRARQGIGRPRHLRDDAFEPGWRILRRGVVDEKGVAALLGDGEEEA